MLVKPILTAVLKLFLTRNVQIATKKWIISFPSDFFIRCPSLFTFITIHSNLQSQFYLDVKLTSSHVSASLIQLTWILSTLRGHGALTCHHLSEFEATTIHLKNLIDYCNSGNGSG
jgi:hypothetical protein